MISPQWARMAFFAHSLGNAHSLVVRGSKMRYNLVGQSNRCSFTPGRSKIVKFWSKKTKHYETPKYPVPLGMTGACKGNPGFFAELGISFVPSSVRLDEGFQKTIGREGGSAPTKSDGEICHF